MQVFIMLLHTAWHFRLFQLNLWKLQMVSIHHAMKYGTLWPIQLEIFKPTALFRFLNSAQISETNSILRRKYSPYFMLRFDFSIQIVHLTLKMA